MMDPFSGLSQKKGSPDVDLASTIPKQGDAGMLARTAPLETSIHRATPVRPFDIAVRWSKLAVIAADSLRKPVHTTASASVRRVFTTGSTMRFSLRMHPLKRLKVS